MPRILIVTGEASGDLARRPLGQGVEAAVTFLAGGGHRWPVDAGGRRGTGEDIPQLDVMGLIGLSAVKTMLKRVSGLGS